MEREGKKKEKKKERKKERKILSFTDKPSSSVANLSLLELSSTTENSVFPRAYSLQGLVTAGAHTRSENHANFEHRGDCCFAVIAGLDAEMAYGPDRVEVVAYGRWFWPSMSIWMIGAV